MSRFGLLYDLALSVCIGAVLMGLVLYLRGVKAPFSVFIFAWVPAVALVALVLLA